MQYFSFWWSVSLLGISRKVTTVSLFSMRQWNSEPTHTSYRKQKRAPPPFLFCIKDITLATAKSPGEITYTTVISKCHGRAFCLQPALMRLCPYSYNYWIFSSLKNLTGFWTYSFWTSLVGSSFGESSGLLVLTPPVLVGYLCRLYS